VSEPCPNLKGREAAHDPKGRFETLELTPDPVAPEDDTCGCPTTLYCDVSKTVLTRNASPDLGCDVSLNPYRGCEPGLPHARLRDAVPEVLSALTELSERRDDLGVELLPGLGLNLGERFVVAPGSLVRPDRGERVVHVADAEDAGDQGNLGAR
jgi:hypothetical protein